MTRPDFMADNPYAAPACETTSAGSSFRCTFLRRALTRAISGRKREPRFNSVTGEFELYTTGVKRLVTICCLFSPILLVVPILMDRSAETLWLAAIAVLIAEGFAAVLWFLSESVFFTDAYVRRFGPCRRHARIDWCNLEKIEVALGGELVLVDNERNKVIIHNDLHGQDVFLATLRKVAPAELIDPHEDSLLELEKLVC